MAAECDVLVCVGWLPVDVKVKSAVSIVDDVDIEHRNYAVLFIFLSPLDVSMDGI